MSLRTTRRRNARRRCTCARKDGWGWAMSKFIVWRTGSREVGFSETVSVAIGKEVVRSLRSLTNNEETTDGFAVIIRLECVGDQVETQEEANRALFKKMTRRGKKKKKESSSNNNNNNNNNNNTISIP